MTDQVSWQPNDSLEAQLQEWVEEVAVSEAPPTGEYLAQVYQNAIEQKDIEKLFKLQAKLSELLTQIAANGTLQPSDLDDERLVGVMEEFDNLKEVKTVYDVRYKMIRTLLFALITKRLADNGVEDPEHAPGEVPVPSLGRKFTREGGRRKVGLDLTALKDKLGPERWERVCKAVVVPAVPEHVEERLDEDELLNLVAEDNTVMELIRDSRTDLGRTPSSFHTRKLSEK